MVTVLIMIELNLYQEISHPTTYVNLILELEEIIHYCITNITTTVSQMYPHLLSQPHLIS